MKKTIFFILQLSFLLSIHFQSNGMIAIGTRAAQRYCSKPTLLKMNEFQKIFVSESPNSPATSLMDYCTNASQYKRVKFLTNESQKQLPNIGQNEN